MIDEVSLLGQKRKNLLPCGSLCFPLVFYLTTEKRLPPSPGRWRVPAASAVGKASLSTGREMFIQAWVPLFEHRVHRSNPSNPDFLHWLSNPILLDSQIFAGHGCGCQRAQVEEKGQQKTDVCFDLCWRKMRRALFGKSYVQVGGPLMGREGKGGLLAQFQSPELPKDFYSQANWRSL